TGQHDKRTATAGVDGSVTFADLATSGQTYVLATMYQGVTYYSEEIDLSQGGTPKNVELPVYATTTDGGNIAATRSHLIVDFDQSTKSLIVLEALVLNNKGDRTYIGGEKKTAEGVPQTLSMRLPDGASNVEFGDGLNAAQASFANGVVADTSPVPPGAKQIVLTYNLPYNAGKAAFSRSLEFSVDRVIVLVRDVGAQVTVDGLPTKDSRDLSGTKYVQISGDNVAANQKIAVNLTNIPDNIPTPLPAASAGQAAPSSVPSQPPWAAVALVGLGLAAGVSYPLIRRRRGSRRVVTAGGSVDTEWDRLLAEVAELDDEHDAGALSDDAYQRQRAAKKTQLTDLSRRLEKA
ncbi:MAG: hypothetical protein ACYC7H_12105, partial [Chloroflexota bacterium]